MARRRYQRGQLIRSGDNWLGRWREDIADDTGAVKRVHKKEVIGTVEGFPTKRLAERELARRLEPINNVEYRPSSTTTFAQFAEKWKKEIMIHHKPSSRSSEESIVDVHLVPFFGEDQLRNIKAEKIQRFVNASEKSAKTIKNHVSLMMVMWDQVKAWEYAQHNPFPRKTNGKLMLIMPRVVKGKGYNFTIEEALAIIAKARGKWKTFFRTMGETGLRPGEMAGLKRDGVVRELQTLKITQSVWGQQVQTPKSAAGVRTMAISASLTEELCDLIDSTPDNDHGLVWVTDKGRGKRNPGGKPLSMDNFRNRVLNPILKELGIDKKLQRLGIKRCGNYPFRHMNATLMDGLNTPMKTRQKRLGHARIETTLTHYTHAIDADNRMAADRIGALLASNDGREAVQ